jgi:hypothetical protein
MDDKEFNAKVRKTDEGEPLLAAAGPSEKAQEQKV